MISKFILILLNLFSILPAQAAGEFEYGPRPALAVFDPAGTLDPAVAKSISDSLAKIYQTEEIDVIVIVIKEIGQAPPEHVARQFTAAWCTSPAHCIVLHVPGRESSPWIIPAGKLIGRMNPEIVKTAVANAHRRVITETNDTNKVKAAANEASDMLRIWMGSAITQTEDTQVEAAKMRIEVTAERRRWTLGVMIAAAAFIPLVAAIVLLVSSDALELPTAGAITLSLIWENTSPNTS
jgi:hypothetical protein